MKKRPRKQILEGRATKSTENMVLQEMRVQGAMIASASASAFAQ